VSGAVGGAVATHDAYAALRIPAVRRYLTGRVAWAMGQQMLNTAIGWQLYERTHSTLALGAVGLAQVIPVVVLALPVGRLVDRHNRRDMAVLSVLTFASCVLGLAAFSYAHLPLWIAYALLFVMGVAQSAHGPATSALFAQICPIEVYENANAWRSTTVQAFMLVGPLVGGTLLATSGATVTYVVAAALVLAFLVLLLRIPRPPSPPLPEVSPGSEARELRAGLDFVFGNQLMLSAITLDLFAVLFGGVSALLPVFAKDILHVGAVGLGGLRCATAAGAALMAFATTRLPPWRHAGRVLLYTVTGFALTIVVFGLSRNYWLSVTMLALGGAFDNVSAVIRMTLEQVVTPEALRGRVSAVNYVFIGLSNEMGEAESGGAAWLVGTTWAVVGGGLLALLVVGIVAWRAPALRRLGRLSELRPG
jgi:MFS family permease